MAIALSDVAVLAEAVMRGLVGAPRATAAAAAASTLRSSVALLRGVAAPSEVDDEVKERLAAIAPVVRMRVSAGASGERANIPGSKRKLRNAAEHHCFGDGPGTWRASPPLSRPRPRAADADTYKQDLDFQHLERRFELLERAQAPSPPAAAPGALSAGPDAAAGFLADATAQPLQPPRQGRPARRRCWPSEPTASAPRADAASTTGLATEGPSQPPLLSGDPPRALHDFLASGQIAARLADFLELANCAALVGASRSSAAPST